MKLLVIKNNHRLKLVIGLVISGLFLYLAFRKVEMAKLVESLGSVNHPVLSMAVISLIVSCWLRAWRHRYLIEVIKPVSTSSLFSALMIGYTANTVLPAHLGEFLRAYVIGKKETLSASLTFATIVTERVIDVLSLLIILLLAVFSYSLPQEVRLSGYLISLFIAFLLLFFWLLKVWPGKLITLLQVSLGRVSNRMAQKAISLILAFRDGLVPLKAKRHYFFVLILSSFIWLCYALVYYFGFYAFNFLERFHLPWSAAFVVMVITTISVVIPSSPGYVGTFHWLNMISLGLFNIPDSEALSYAIVIHAVSTIPIVLLGFFLAWRERVGFSVTPAEVIGDMKP